jgi:magnesium transporter
MKSVHNLREELLFLHKPIWPLREMITNMQGEETPLISDSTRLYLRDVHDHIVRVIDTMETFRDTTSGMLDVYLSSVSNKTNEIMKILTIVTTIFIPLSFIAGVYGMNFLNMPELRWELGYPLVLLSMAISGAVMLVYFKRKKWI